MYDKDNHTSNQRYMNKSNIIFSPLRLANMKMNNIHYVRGTVEMGHMHTQPVGMQVRTA